MITDEQIGLLANEAARAGDHAMVEICENALGAGDVGIHATEQQQREAREECERVITHAAAQRDLGVLESWHRERLGIR